MGQGIPQRHAIPDPKRVLALECDSEPAMLTSGAIQLTHLGNGDKEQVNGRMAREMSLREEKNTHMVR